MDIDDILASVDRDDVASPELTALDHQQLTRLWVAERAVSELLPWPGALMERMMERVRKQVCVYLFMLFTVLEYLIFFPPFFLQVAGLLHEIAM